jgi:hypothetical protein
MIFKVFEQCLSHLEFVNCMPADPFQSILLVQKNLTGRPFFNRFLLLAHINDISQITLGVWKDDKIGVVTFV